jgi:N-acetylmuramoyl-L-alanine amidase
MPRLAWALPALAVLLSACGTGPAIGQSGPAAGQSGPAAGQSGPVAGQSGPAAGQSGTAGQAAQSAASSPATHASTKVSPKPIRSPRPVADSDPSTASGGPGRFPPTGRGILDGKVVLVDPGHNGGNFAAPSVINRLIWNGRENETCDTTGAETDGGYTEALFNWHVALYLTAYLRAEGATVVLTRTSNTAVGPCVTERAAIGNEVHANAAISIHADGGPPGGRGFAILEPVADGINNAIVGPSAVLGADLRAAFQAGTEEPVSSYDGVNGVQLRDDLAGINLSTVPKVFIECANMRNAADAALVTSTRWQAQAARAIAAGLAAFLAGRR